ncbi:hypothetical protein P4S72_21850 [Vibrio sp. PP-XX7]
MVSLWLTFWAWDYFKYALRVWKETPTLYIPTFIYECALFISMVLICGFLAMHIMRLVRHLACPEYLVKKA